MMHLPIVTELWHGPIRTSFMFSRESFSALLRNEAISWWGGGMGVGLYFALVIAVTVHVCEVLRVKKWLCFPFEFRFFPDVKKKRPDTN